MNKRNYTPSAIINVKRDNYTNNTILTWSYLLPWSNHPDEHQVERRKHREMRELHEVKTTFH